MLTGSISLGRLAGAALRVHWSAIVIGALLAAVSARDFGLRLRRDRRGRLLRLDPRP